MVALTLPGGDMSGRNEVLRRCSFCLRSPDSYRDQSADELECPVLQRRGQCQLVYTYPTGEHDRVVSQGGEVVEQARSALQRLAVGADLGGVLVLTFCERTAGATGSARVGVSSSMKHSGANALHTYQRR